MSQRREEGVFLFLWFLVLLAAAIRVLPGIAPSTADAGVTVCLAVAAVVFVPLAAHGVGRSAR